MERIKNFCIAHSSVFSTLRSAVMKPDSRAIKENLNTLRAVLEKIYARSALDAVVRLEESVEALNGDQLLYYFSMLEVEIETILPTFKELLRRGDFLDNEIHADS